MTKIDRSSILPKRVPSRPADLDQAELMIGNAIRNVGIGGVTILLNNAWAEMWDKEQEKNCPTNDFILQQIARTGKILEAAADAVQANLRLEFE
jgi:hypothetical protein